MIKKPGKFTGTNVDGFMLKTALYVERNATKVRETKTKVLFLLSLIKGEAVIWAKIFVEHVQPVQSLNFGMTINLE